jgi:hypothetical protein
VAVGCNTGSVYFVDVLHCRVSAQIASSNGFRSCDHFSIDARGNYAALLSEDGVIKLYDLIVMRKNTANYKDLDRFVLRCTCACACPR